MLEDICEANELLLVKVKIYESGDALRANLYLAGKKDLVLRNYRASDAVALAVYYKIPILVRSNMLKSYRRDYVTISLILSSSTARLISMAMRRPIPNVVPY